VHDGCFLTILGFYCEHVFEKISQQNILCRCPGSFYNDERFSARVMFNEVLVGKDVRDVLVGNDVGGRVSSLIGGNTS
jgi:hypothetical protein